MRNGSIIECDLNKVLRETIIHSHHDGEVWGLCLLEDQGKFITSCDDNKILMYEISTKMCVQKGFVQPPLPEGKE